MFIMQPDYVKIGLSVFLVVIGIFFSLRPKQSLKFIHSMEKNYQPSPRSQKNYRFGGALLIALGLFYLLGQMGIIPADAIKF